VIMSDKEKGLDTAAEEVLPSASHSPVHSMLLQIYKRGKIRPSPPR
jgi:hypothetical protein